MAHFNRLVDVGGCSGSFSVAALSRYPHMQGVVFDLPKLEPFLQSRAREFGLEARLSFKPGNFFSDPLPKGDLYALGYIL